VSTGASVLWGDEMPTLNSKLCRAARQGRHADMVAALEGGAEIDSKVSRRAERGGRSHRDLVGVVRRSHRPVPPSTVARRRRASIARALCGAASAW
jgi:hypothetical protein